MKDIKFKQDKYKIFQFPKIKLETPEDYDINFKEATTTFSSYVNDEIERVTKEINKKLFEWLKQGFNYVNRLDEGIKEIEGVYKLGVNLVPMKANKSNESVEYDLKALRNKLEEMNIDYMNMSLEEVEKEINKL